VALSLAKERPTTRVLGLDISSDAVVVARDNLVRLGAVNCAIGQSDLYAALGPGRPWFDLITANPPYIPDGEIPALDVDIRGFEPHLALAGGGDGLSVMQRVISDAPKHLAKGGVLAVEMMTGQVPAVAAFYEQCGFFDILIKKDLGGRERVVSGIWP
jgi:release factor glutamine methyltransferase